MKESDKLDEMMELKYWFFFLKNLSKRTALTNLRSLEIPFLPLLFME